MIGICSYGAYVPLLRLKREDMIPLGGFAQPGEKSVANFDEDSLTMAVEAAQDCLVGTDRDTVDSWYFTSVTPPFVEKQSASIAASALDLGEDTYTVDLCDSLRASIDAIKLAADAVKAGSAKKVMITASDQRMAPPMSMMEQNLGDGAAAVLIGNTNVVANIEGIHSVSSEFTDHWRPDGEKFVHYWQDRFSLVRSYQPYMEKAITEAMKKFGLEAKDIAKVVYNAPDARSHGNLGRALKLDSKQIQNPLLEVMGNTGAAFPLMLLVAALEDAKPGDRILIAAYGDGASVLILKVTNEIKKMVPRRGMKGHLKSKRKLSNYMRYMRMRHLYPLDSARTLPVIPGFSQLWREKESMLRFKASQCKQCGWVEFPIRRVCPKCFSKDNFDKVRLLDKKATLMSFSTDTTPLIPNATDAPMGRALVDFEGGAKVEGEMTDWGAIEDLEVGQPLEMTFRRYERQGDVHAYSWKPRPVR